MATSWTISMKKFEEYKARVEVAIRPLIPDHPFLGSSTIPTIAASLVIAAFKRSCTPKKRTELLQELLTLHRLPFTPDKMRAIMLGNKLKSYSCRLFVLFLSQHIRRGIVYICVCLHILSRTMSVEGTLSSKKAREYQARVEAAIRPFIVDNVHLGTETVPIIAVTLVNAAFFRSYTNKKRNELLQARLLIHNLPFTAVEMRAIMIG